VNIRGPLRVYFNVPGDKPWCVAPTSGLFEVCVRSVTLVGVRCETLYAPQTSAEFDANRESGTPSAWLVVYGDALVGDGGHAVIKPSSAVS